MRRIAITGMGVVSPIGNTLESALKNALRGASGIRRCDERLDGEHGAALRCRVAGLVTDFDASKWVDARYTDSYDPSTLYALAATAEALADAELDFDDALKDRTAVMIGTAAAGFHTHQRELRRAFVEGAVADIPGRALLQVSGNIHSGLVALTHGFRGPNFGVADACATGATTLSLAADAIKLGRADVVVAGGTDAPVGLEVFGSMISAGAMNPTADPERACCPFSAERRGLIVGEGAGVFVLEALDDAWARGAHVHGELLGAAMTNDAHHVYSPDRSGASWARTIELALADAGVPPDAIDLVSAHAASTPSGDLTETRAIKQALGRRAHEIPVVSTKSQIGHTFGAGGAIELALTLAGLNLGFALPTINLHVPDPECDLNYVPHEGRRADGSLLLKNSYGFAGTNTCLVVRGER